jgi:mRNA-decapping enzyme subunit 2
MKKKFGAIIFNTSFQLLVVRGRGHNKWGLPKGKRKVKDMDDFACAAREVFEETSIDITKYRVSEVTTTCESTKYYIVKVPDDIYFAPIDKREIAEAKFMSYDELALYDTNHTTRIFLQKYENIKKQMEKL